MKQLQSMHLLYKLGGARGGPENGIANPAGPGLGWTDCSGFAYYLLGIANVPVAQPGGWTGTLKSEGVEGTSPYLTLFLKEPDKIDGHVIVRLRHHPDWRRRLGMAAKFRWVECGGRDNPQAGGGPTYFRPTQARIAEFPIQRHFPDLDKRIREAMRKGADASNAEAEEEVGRLRAENERLRQERERVQ